MIESDTTNAIPDKEEPRIDETIVPKDRERQKTAPSRTFAFESNPVLETYLDRHYRGLPVEFGTVRVGKASGFFRVDFGRTGYRRYFPCR